MDTIEMPVTYLLLLHVAEGTHVRIGSLGEYDFAVGYYAYVGSARKNARSRLGRHLAGNAIKKRWHIDYLRPHCLLLGVHIFDADLMGECQLAREVSERPAATTPIRRFGSSDCRCPAHLIYFGLEPPCLEFSVPPWKTL